MQTKIKIYVSIGVLCLFTIFCGCGWKKEILLERSQTESVSLGQDVMLATDDQQSLETEGAHSGQDGTEAKTDPLPAAEDAESDLIYVHVCGQVIKPGVYQLSTGARVFTVIEMAGGLTADADSTSVNQAQVLGDGQMVYIPAVGEEWSGAEGGTSEDEALENDTDTRVDINTADLETLMTLPGIGQGKAQSILDYRQEHGVFSSIEEIMQVDGIKEGTYAKFKDMIRI